MYDERYQQRNDRMTVAKKEIHIHLDTTSLHAKYFVDAKFYSTDFAKTQNLLFSNCLTKVP